MYQMKQQLQSLSSYHIWANKLLFDRILKLDAAAAHTEIASSFPSLYKTVLHMWDAESLWWQRLRLQETQVRPSESFTGDFRDLVKAINEQSMLWKSWIDEARPVQIEHVFEYRTMKGDVYKSPVYEVVVHLYNHGTYHRGQIVTLLHHLGVKDIPGTDYIAFARFQKP